jgi:outer membrane receptor protein involved in Fe transport
LDAVFVTAKRVTREDVVPVRRIESIYGTEASIIDTPRSVTELNAKQVASDPIRTADDLVKYAPGVTRGGGQNVNLAPVIRGQNSELFQEGQGVIDFAGRFPPSRSCPATLMRPPTM